MTPFQGRRLSSARGAFVVLAGASLAACATMQGPAPDRSAGGVNGTMRPYEVHGVWYRPAEQPRYQKVGTASWYGAQFHNRRTADGEIFDMDIPSAAHTTLPLPCIVEVTNLDNGRRLRVRVNDRGPFVGGRLIDLSREGAKELGFYDKGTARVRVRYVGPAPLDGNPGTSRLAQASTRRRSQRAPPYASDVVATPPPVSSPAPAPAAVSLPPVTPTIEPQQQPAPEPPASPPATVQAAAFADLQNAERAAAALSAEGSTSISPLERPGTPLYRVMVTGAPSEDAQTLRGKVAGAGYPDARVVAGS
jgi:rare lipoprotein A